MDGRELLERHESKDLLRFLTAGSVDDGKSTLIGRLLYDSKRVYEDHLAALKRASEKAGAAAGGIDFSLLVDGLRAEREQGITIDVAYRYFSTPMRKFIIADTPGHEQYTRNMATGASTADLAIILIDARHGVLPQTRRHSFIASLLGIKHLLVAVNKMDLVDYDQSVFESIKNEFAGFAARLEVTDVHVIPISALKGDNVVDVSRAMPWYKGGTLLGYLETVHIASDRNFVDFRFPVQYVVRPDTNFRGYCGTVASGIVRKGDEVIVLPSGSRSRVGSIVTYDGEIDQAWPPMAVTLTLDDEIDVARGDMLIHINNVPRIGATFEAMVVWMSETPMKPGNSYVFKHTTNSVAGKISRLRYRMNINSLHREQADRLSLNEIGLVRIDLKRSIAFDNYSRNRATGCFIVIDQLTNNTVAAGMILERRPNELLAAGANECGRSDNVRARHSRVSPGDRVGKYRQRPVTLWLTGLPKAGKTTIAYALEQRLFDAGYFVFVIDGENMRLGPSSDLGFSGEDRSENIRRVAAIARMCNDSGQIVIASFVSPYRVDREKAREHIGPERFMEIYVEAPSDTRHKRDSDGLYAAAEKGDIANFSGVSAPYEEPRAPELVLHTDKLDIEESVDLIMSLLEERKVLLP